MSAEREGQGTPGSVAGRTGTVEERRTLSIALAYRDDRGETCVACGESASGQHALPVGESGEIVENEHGGEWAGVPACRPCFDAHAADGLEGLEKHLRHSRDERVTRRHRGLLYYRIGAGAQWPEHPNGRREQIFADEWARENVERDLIALMAWAACEPEDPGAVRNFNRGEMPAQQFSRCLLEGGATDRDRAIAATVAQWLGTNVGFDWLEMTLRRAGYKLERIRE